MNFFANDSEKWASDTTSFSDEKWASSANMPSKMVIENDGKLKMYNASGNLVWSNK